MSNTKPKRLSITWRPGLLEWLRAHAKDREVTVSQAVNDLVEESKQRKEKVKS